MRCLWEDPGTVPRFRRAAGVRVALAALVVGVLASSCGPLQAPLATTQPSSPFTYASAAWDANHHELLMFDFIQAATGAHNETWAWYGGGWHRLGPDSTPTPAREAPLLADPAAHQIFIAGGSYAPPPSVGPATTCGQVLCHPGTIHPVRPFVDYWRWDGANWRQFTPSPIPGPGPFESAYLASSGLLLGAFGNLSVGADDGTYTWDGTGWRQISHEWLPDNSAYATDPVTGTVVAYAGRQEGCIPDPCFSAASTTVLGDGVSWRPLAGTEPEPASGNIVTDPVDGGVLLLNELGHTWVLRGDSWREVARSGPDPRIPGFLYSDGSGVFFQPQPGVHSPRWSWDGRTWSSVGISTVSG